MEPRLAGLQGLDPLSVPLPHGTEVTTRVDHLREDGRVVPRGCVGRVVALHPEGAIEVQVVGVGRLKCQRADLVPRKQGQIRYAVARETAWQALRACVVVETTVGSRAWGLADEHSDEDHRGVLVLPFLWTAALNAAPTELVSADGSSTYWELRKAVQQGLRADPNTLEALFVPGAHALDDLGAWLLDARDAFVSRHIYGSFGRYALSQLGKLGAGRVPARTRWRTRARSGSPPHPAAPGHGGSGKVA